MAHKETRLRSKDRRSRASAADALRTLADRIQANQLTLAGSDGDVSLDIPDEVSFKVKVQEKHKPSQSTHQLEIEITWPENVHTRRGVEIR